MKVRFNLLHWSERFQAALRRDGWVILEPERKDEVQATHPQVGNEQMARTRLHRLGLLNAGSVRIEFWPWSVARQVESRDYEKWSRLDFFDPSHCAANRKVILLLPARRQ
jgi:hypothetical protein